MAKKRLWGFSERVADRLVRLAGEDQLSPKDAAGVGVPLPRHGGTAAYVAKTPSGGIPARSGNQLSKALCVVYEIDATDNLAIAKTTDGADLEITVYNLASAPVSGSEFIQVKREIMSGKLMADMEDC